MLADRHIPAALFLSLLAGCANQQALLPEPTDGLEEDQSGSAVEDAAPVAEDAAPVAEEEGVVDEGDQGRVLQHEGTEIGVVDF